MDIIAKREFKKLQQKEVNIYYKIKKIIDLLPIKKQQEFYTLLQEYLNNQIEIEMMCNQ